MSSKRIHQGVVCKCQICGVDFHPPLSSVGCGLQLHPGTGQFCSRSCSAVGRRGPRKAYGPRGGLSLPLDVRLWRKVNKDGPVPADASLGNCWLWMGALTAGGYGVIKEGPGKGNLRTHRLSYELEFGSVAEDVMVLHRCDRVSCLRPSHLFLGDAGDNARDMITKGRQKPHVKLTPDKIRAIRWRRSLGETQDSLAHDFDVSQAVISAIVRRRTWKHIV